MIIKISEDSKVYIQNSVYHREDGPAVCYPYSQEWYFRGVIHRDNGPARMFRKEDGSLICEWWINGEYTAWADYSLPNCDKNLFEHFWTKSDSQNANYDAIIGTQ